MGNTYSVLKGQSSDFLLEKMKADAMFEAAHCDKDPITYLKIIQKLYYNNKS